MRGRLPVSALIVLLAVAPSMAQGPQTGAFTYQGRLESGGSPYTGTADLRFALFDDPTTGTQQGTAEVVSNVTVTNGVFTATLNAGAEFGATPFDGNQRWLKISVRTPHDPTNTASFTVLAPRQALTAAPYAIGLAFPFLGTGSTPSAPLLVIQNAGFGEAITGQSTSGHGIYGRNGAGSGQQPLFGYGTGVWGDSDNGNGVVGTSGTAFGVYGLFGPPSGFSPSPSGVVGDSHNGIGVVGMSSSNIAVYGVSAGSAGVFGQSGSASGVSGLTLTGVSGDCSNFGAGVQGTATNNSYGVFARASGSGSIALAANAQSGASAGAFVGDVSVTGTLSKGGGSFKIDHPLDPENKYLYHSFVESPDMMNIYNGNVTTDANGYATLVMPEWMEALNKDFRYQLTVLDDGNGDEFIQAKVVQKIHANTFTIRTSRGNTEVSWQVTGVRQDAFANAHRVPVEEYKKDEDRGFYLYPAEQGQPEERGIDRKRMGRASRTPAARADASSPPTGDTAAPSGSPDLEPPAAAPIARAADAKEQSR